MLRHVAEVEYGGQVPLQATLVPARAVYLVSEGSQSGFRRAVQEASTRWGGVTEPIVPVSADGHVGEWARRLVEITRVDGAVNVDIAETEAAMAAAELGLQWVPLAQIDSAGPVMWTCHPARVGPPAPPGQSYVMASEVGELWQVAAAGDLTEEQVATSNPSLLPVRRPQSGDEIGRAQLSGSTLLDRIAVAFGEAIGSQAPGSGPTIVWVTANDDLRDCWDFWNLRALHPLRCATLPMILLPVNEIQHWLNFDRQFAHTLRRPHEFTPDVLLTSTNIDESKLHEVARLLQLEHADTEVSRGYRYPPSVRHAPFTYSISSNITPLVTFNRIYGESTIVDVHLFKDSTTVRFTSPVEFTSGLTLVRLSGTPFQGLPRRAAVARLIEPNSQWYENSIQLNTHALRQYCFEIQVPGLSDSVHALLADATATYQLSDQGSLAVGLQQQNDAIEALLEPGVFEVIRQLTTRRSKSFINELKALAVAGEITDEIREFAEVWGGRAGRLYRSVPDLEGITKRSGVMALERLCSLGWVERGLEIRCTNCKIGSFVLLSDVPASGPAMCPGCAAKQNYTSRSSADLSIFYRLNSIVDRASDQGVLPHLLVVAALSRQHARSWFLPGVNVVFGDDAKTEIDIFGVRNGQVVLGEVKTSASEFDIQQIAKDVEFCTRLRADIYAVAAPDDIGENISATAKQLCEAAGLELLVLGRSDLRPSL